MTCPPLPDAGLSANLAPVAFLGIVCLGVGVMVLLADRSRTTRIAASALMVLLLGTAVVSTPRELAQAADCAASDNSLTITQTSALTGLAPGVAPVPITGLVVNNGPDGTHIAVIEVSITSVVVGSSTVSGQCNATDYRITGPRMVVDRHLASGASTPFGGATIGFSNKVTNQDRCKNAVVHLRYITRP